MVKRQRFIRKDVRANCFCASLLRTQFTPRCHATSILIPMHGINSLKYSVTPDFLLIDHFLCRLSTLYEKIEENLCCGSLIFFNFSVHASSNSAIILAAQCRQKSILKVEFNWKDDTSSNYLLDEI